MIIEPILGEGGYVVPPPGFLEGVQALCREHGILFIVDEVQSGFGRAGKWMAHEHWALEPDVVVMAKGIASGFPLSGIAARPELMERWPAGTHGGTYGGNAVSCAAAVATIRVIRDEELLANSTKMGEALQTGLRQVAADFPSLGDVRGRGLMVASEFTQEDGSPHSKLAKLVMAECKARGLLLLTCGTAGNVIRWIPPLIVDEGHLDEGLGIFTEALAAATATLEGTD
jgi:4-aminobutyrate aminotransferase